MRMRFWDKGLATLRFALEAGAIGFCVYFVSKIAGVLAGHVTKADRTPSFFPLLSRGSFNTWTVGTVTAALWGKGERAFRKTEVAHLSADCGD